MIFRVEGKRISVQGDMDCLPDTEIIIPDCHRIIDTYGQIEMDLTLVNHMDSQGLMLIISLYKYALQKEQEPDITIIAKKSSIVRRLLQLTNVDLIMKVEYV